MSQFLSRWTAICLLALISFTASADTYAQESKETQAIIAFSVDIQKIFDSKELKAIDRETFAKLTDMDEEAKSVFMSLKKIEAIAAGPQGGFDPRSLMQTDFLMKVHFTDEAVAKKMEGELSNGFAKTERDGKAVWQAEGQGAPPIFAQRSGTEIHFGSEDFLLSSEKIERSKTLTELTKKNSTSPAYLVGDMDGARELLSEIAENAREGADIMTKQYIGLLDEVATVDLSVNLDKSNMLHLELAGHNEKETKKIKLKIDAAVGLMQTAAQFGMAQIEKESPEMAKLASELLDGIEVKNENSKAVVDVQKPNGFGEMILNAVKSAQKTAKKIQSLNNMKQVSLSMHNYYDVYKKFPFPKDVKSAKLSWRVGVLPFLEEARLYDKFDTDSDWKSGANKALASEMPEIFTFTSGGVISFVMPENVPQNFGSILDGTSNTIALVENRKAKMTPWTKPAGVTPEQLAAMVADLDDNDSLVVGFYDGHVRRISNKTSKQTILSLCSPAGGEIVDEDAIQ